MLLPFTDDRSFARIADGLLYRSTNGLFLLEKYRH